MWVKLSQTINCQVPYYDYAVIVNSEHHINFIQALFHPQKRKPRCGFVEEEAELTDSDASKVSSDELDDSVLDRYDASFVNDATVLSQAGKSCR